MVHAIPYPSNFWFGVLDKTHIKMGKSAAQTAGAAATKKKAPAKPRKRKASDGGGGKNGASTSKRVANEESRTPHAGDKTGGSGSNEAHAAAALKPFVKGELVESSTIH